MSNGQIAGLLILLLASLFVLIAVWVMAPDSPGVTLDPDLQPDQDVDEAHPDNDLR